jgi:DNA-binding SARP family transcriptional activator
MSAERRRLHELAVQVFSGLVDHYAGVERLDRAIAVAERLLTLDPLLETAHRSLMRLYLRSVNEKIERAAHSSPAAYLEERRATVRHGLAWLESAGRDPHSPRAGSSGVRSMVQP